MFNATMLSLQQKTCFECLNITTIKLNEYCTVFDKRLLIVACLGGVLLASLFWILFFKYRKI